MLLGGGRQGVMEAAQPSQAGVVAAAKMERIERPFQGQVTGLGAGGRNGNSQD